MNTCTAENAKEKYRFVFQYRDFSSPMFSVQLSNLSSFYNYNQRFRNETKPFPQTFTPWSLSWHCLEYYGAKGRGHFSVATLSEMTCTNRIHPKIQGSSLLSPTKEVRLQARASGAQALKGARPGEVVAFPGRHAPWRARRGQETTLGCKQESAFHRSIQSLQRRYKHLIGVLGWGEANLGETVTINYIFTNVEIQVQCFSDFWILKSVDWMSVPQGLRHSLLGSFILPFPIQCCSPSP